MTLYGLVWPCIAFFGLFWPFMPFFAFFCLFCLVWPCMAFYGLLRQNIVFSRSHTNSFGLVDSVNVKPTEMVAIFDVVVYFAYFIMHSVVYCITNDVAKCISSLRDQSSKSNCLFTHLSIHICLSRF